MGDVETNTAPPNNTTNSPKKATCHPDRPHKAKGLCASCYVIHRSKERVKNASPEEKRDLAAKLDLKNPAVIDTVAEALVANTLDTRAAIRQLKPEISDQRVVALADKVDAAPEVKAAVEKKLKDRGIRLGEDDKKEFVARMWDWMDMGKEAMQPIFKEDGTTRDFKLEIRRQEVAMQYTLKAAQILGKGFIGEKVTVDKPEPLLVEGVAGIMSNWEKQGKDAPSDKPTALTAPSTSPAPPKGNYDA